jgi:hypothetical protein
LVNIFDKILSKELGDLDSKNIHSCSKLMIFNIVFKKINNIYCRTKYVGIVMINLAPV